jgi:hypothetical protein
MLCVCGMYVLTYAIRMQVRCERRRLERLTHAMRMLYVRADVCYTYAGALRAEAPRAPDACYAYAVCTC